MPEITFTELTAADGHRLHAVLAQPDLEPLGGIVLLHEIFGVTEQMKGLATTFAEKGYRVTVPALFDRERPNCVLDYEQMGEARDMVSRIELACVLQDVAATAEAVRCGDGVAVAGYCWGGGLAYLAACRMNINCAVVFYGTRLPSYLGEKPRCPMQFHFGALDKAMPPGDIKLLKEANPEQEYYIYEEAGHAFANEARPNHHPASRRLAEQRMLDFLYREFAHA